MKHQHHHHQRGVVERAPIANDEIRDMHYPTKPLIVRDVVQARSTPSPTESDSCAPNDTSSRCQKSVSSSTMTIPIILGAAIPIAAALIILFILHRRHVRKLRLEDKMDKTRSMDFGMDLPSASGGKKKNKQMGAGQEKPGLHRNQFSLDMNLTAPYLLPPHLNGSQESLHSITRVYAADDDIYKQAMSASRSIAGSIAPTTQSNKERSGPRNHRDSSIYTASIRHPEEEQSTESLTADLLNHSAKMSTTKPPVRKGSLQPNQNQIPEIQFPEPALQKLQTGQQGSRVPGLQASQTEVRDSYIEADSGDLRRSHMHLVPHIGFDASQHLNNGAGSKTTMSNSPLAVELPASTDAINKNRALPANPRPVKSHEQQGTSQGSNQGHNNQQAPSDFANMHNGLHVTPPSPTYNTPQMTGNNTSLPQVVEPQQGSYQAPVGPRMSSMGGLEVNHGNSLDPRRLSYGFRPLPPSADVGDNPEERAMRIRSFYKEYFDESNPGAFDYYAQMPEAQDYYYEEDYSHGYNQEHGDYYHENVAPIYDEYTDDMVMTNTRPFAEPLARRAMTPPPRAPPKFQTQNQNRPRAGSMSSSAAPPPRSYSSQSGRYNGPQQRGPRGPTPLRKAVKPAEPLMILPTPHMLREDAFASPIMFAPAPRAKEYQAGTESETGSVRGGMRAYSPTVRAHTPLASAFDELIVLPTPHQMRRSGTFTALDFAPPRKFKGDNDQFSDSGSIRSNRTGYSAAQNIRNGAYRVSRLPQDVVPSVDNTAQSLKPSWNMHNN